MGHGIAAAGGHEVMDDGGAEEHDRQLRDVEAPEDPAVCGPVVQASRLARSASRHELAYRPFRVWCADCVAGRPANDPHRMRARIEHDGAQGLRQLHVGVGAGRTRPGHRRSQDDLGWRLRGRLWESRLAEFAEQIMARSPGQPSGVTRSPGVISRSISAHIGDSGALGGRRERHGAALRVHPP